MSRRISTTTPGVTERRFRRRNKDRVRFPDPVAPPAVDPFDDPSLLARRDMVLVGGTWPAVYGDDAEPFTNLTGPGLVVACRRCGAPTAGQRPGPASQSDGIARVRQWREFCPPCEGGGWALDAFRSLLGTIEGATAPVIAEARRQAQADPSWLPVVTYDDAPGAARDRPITPWSHIDGMSAYTSAAKAFRWPSVDEGGGTVWVQVDELAERPTCSDVFARWLDDVGARLRQQEVVPPPEAWAVPACWWCGIDRAPRKDWAKPRGGLVWCGQGDICPRPDGDNVALTAPRALARVFWGTEEPPPDDTGEPSKVTDSDARAARRAGFRFWGEVEGLAPNGMPWAHVDADAAWEAVERHLAAEYEGERRRDWSRYRDGSVTVVGPDGKPGIQEPWANAQLRDGWYLAFPWPHLVDVLWPLPAGDTNEGDNHE